MPNSWNIIFLTEIYHQEIIDNGSDGSFSNLSLSRFSPSVSKRFLQNSLDPFYLINFDFIFQKLKEPVIDKTPPLKDVVNNLIYPEIKKTIQNEEKPQIVKTHQDGSSKYLKEQKIWRRTTKSKRSSAKALSAGSLKAAAEETTKSWP